MYWTSSDGLIELNITKSQARMCSHSGPCDDDVERLSKLPAIARQLRKIKVDLLVGELEEYGAWDGEELKDHEQNLRRLLWLACGNITESER